MAAWALGQSENPANTSALVAALKHADAFRAGPPLPERWPAGRTRPPSSR